MKFIYLIIALWLGSHLVLSAQESSSSPTPVSETKTSPEAVPPPAPVRPIPIALPEPATLPRITFLTKDGTLRDKLILTISPNHIRIDQPLARLTVIYERATQVFIGLEQSNATWWTFSWPEIQTYLQKSQRYEARLRDLTSDGLVDYDTPPAQTPSTASSDPTSTTDIPGAPHIVWENTQQTKLVAGYPCTLWTGTYPTGDVINVWCTLGLKQEVLNPIQCLREINEPMALGPVRQLAPPSIFPIYDTLTKGGNTPILLSWGSKQNGNQFAIEKIDTLTNRPDLFKVPKYFTATTLITLDGIIPSQTSTPRQ